MSWCIVWSHKTISVECNTKTLGWEYQLTDNHSTCSTAGRSTVMETWEKDRLKVWVDSKPCSLLGKKIQVALQIKY